MSNDEGSVKGKGPSIMMPPQGNPFASEEPPVPGEALPTGAEMAEDAEPRDLSPEEAATMFPGSEPAPGVAEMSETTGIASLDQSLSEAADPDLGVSSLGADVDIPGHSFANEEALRTETLPTLGGAEVTVVGAPASTEFMSAEELAALHPSSHADRLPTEGAQPAEEAPGVMVSADMSETSPSLTGEATDMAVQAAQAQAEVLSASVSDTPPSEPVVAVSAVLTDSASPEQPASVATVATTIPAAGEEAGAAPAVRTSLQLSEDVGLAVTTYQRGAALPSQKALVGLFISDDQLVNLWREIEKIEVEVTQMRGGSLKLARELLDRLATARNLLMNERDQYDDALREVAEVKFRLTRVRDASGAQQPRPILGFLLLVLAILGLAFVFTDQMWTLIGRPDRVAGTTFPTLWNTMLWGGLGGLSGALYGLWKHVARDQDYDPQHAQWYYLNPIMGLIFGPLIALVAQIGLPAFFTFASTETGNIQIEPVVLYVLAWVVGFQQNLLLSLINSVLKRISPADPPTKSVTDTQVITTPPREG